MSGAKSVAFGILASRVLGFVRQRCLALVFGVGDFADVFGVALRAPNILQNLLGEQSLSASFIPVYSRLLESGDHKAAGRFAGAVFGLLAALATVLVAVGVLLAPQIVAMFVPGFLGDAAAVAAGTAGVDRYALTVRAVRIIFPMTGTLVLSAWALGVLNSHRRFFLAYCAPVLWNLSIIGALVAAARWWWPLGSASTEVRLESILIAACLGALIGAVLQLVVQLPTVLRLNRGLRPSLDRTAPGVGEAGRAFLPLLLGRGVVQLSGYIDLVLASFLLPGAISSLNYSQTLAVLPVSLFAMSIAAAELPELSRQRARDEDREVATRIARTLGQSAFLTLPTAVGYILLGFWIVGGIYRGGEFGLGDNWLVAAVLAAYAVGLLASTSSRLLNNLFYASGKTKIPARIAAMRVLAASTVGASLMMPLDRVPIGRWLPVEASPLHLGAVGVASGAAVGAWFEFVLLMRATRQVIDGGVVFPWRRIGTMAVVAVIACVPPLVVREQLENLSPWLSAAAVIGGTAVIYLGLSLACGISEARELLTRVVTRRR